MTDLHTTELGSTGPRLVFLHGLFGQGKNWTQIGKQFAQAHRVLLVDLPHHGRSGWPEEFDFVAHADQIAGLLDPADPVALVGHSLGGKIAMVLALRHPELVERLCVVDVSPVTYTHTTEFAGYMDAMLALDLDSLERRADAEAALVTAVPNPTVRSFLLQNLHRDETGWRWQPNLAVLRRDLAEVGSWPEIEGRYPGPVLWLGGAESNYVRDEYAPAMEAYFPRVRRVTIKGAGHWVHSEQPQIFTEVLRRFVDGQASGAAAD